jgi:hypothetical protein
MIMMRYSMWVDNIVHVIKKNGEIRLCVEFRKLSKESIKSTTLFPRWIK